MALEMEVMEQGKRKRFTGEQKLAIIREWERLGNGAEVARKYQVHPNVMYRWKKRLDLGARELLKGRRRKKDEEVRRLEEEIRRLKEVVVRLSEELMLLKKEMNSD